MSVMTPVEFSRAEYSADHSALFRRNSRNLRGPKVRSRGRGVPQKILKTYLFSEAERRTHKMHILGIFCRKKQFSRATKGLSQDGDEIFCLS
jgi:hypothetical protein